MPTSWIETSPGVRYCAMVSFSADSSPEPAGLGEVVEHLDRALAEGLPPDDERAVVVLQRAGDDLARRGGAVVHDDDEREAR